jgi:hypothetical protein
MPRPPKANKDLKLPVPQPVMPAVVPRSVEVDDFVRVRDSVRMFPNHIATPPTFVPLAVPSTSPLLDASQA